MQSHRTSAAEVVLLGLTFVLLSTTSLHAEPQAHDFGVFADLQGTQSTLDLPAFSPKNIYVVGFGLDGFVKGYEFAIDIPDEITVLLMITNPLCQFACSTPPNILVGLGGCFAGEPKYNLATVNLGYFESGSAPEDALVCLGTPTPSSAALDGRPGYLQCDNDLVPFGYAQDGGEYYPDGCLVINPTHPLEGPVAVEELGLGVWKARYRAN